VLVYDNDIDGNASGSFASPTLDIGYGGGMLTTATTAQTVSRRNPTDIVGNRITNNTASSGGGGASTWVFADAGPTSYCEVSLRHNTVTNNEATNGSGDTGLDAYAGGFELFTQAAGAGIARIDTAYNTITGNSAEIGGGGIDVAGVTGQTGAGNGTALIEIANSLIENNTVRSWAPPPIPILLYPGSSVYVCAAPTFPQHGGAVESTWPATAWTCACPASTAAERAFPGIDSDNDVDGVDSPAVGHGLRLQAGGGALQPPDGSRR
jgi:hypothetical protein